MSKTATRESPMELNLYPFIGSIFDILNFSYFIIALFFRHRVSKFIDLYLNRQACKLTGKLVSFSLSVLKFVFLGDGGGGGV